MIRTVCPYCGCDDHDGDCATSVHACIANLRRRIEALEQAAKPEPPAPKPVVSAIPTAEEFERIWLKSATQACPSVMWGIPKTVWNDLHDHIASRVVEQKPDPPKLSQTWREKDGRLIHDGDCHFWSKKICTCGLLHRLQVFDPQPEWWAREYGEQEGVLYEPTIADPPTREALAKIIDDAYPPHMGPGMALIVADAILNAFPGKLKLRRMPSAEEMHAKWNSCDGPGQRGSWAQFHKWLAELSEPVKLDEEELAKAMYSNDGFCTWENDQMLRDRFRHRAASAMSYFREQAGAVSASGTPDRRLTVDEWIRELRAWCDSQPQLPPADDSRASIYDPAITDSPDAGQSVTSAKCPDCNGANYAPHLGERGLEGFDRCKCKAAKIAYKDEWPIEERACNICNIWHVNCNVPGKALTLEQFRDRTKESRGSWLAVARAVAEEIRAAKRDTLQRLKRLWKAGADMGMMIDNDLAALDAGAEDRKAK